MAIVSKMRDVSSSTIVRASVSAMAIWSIMRDVLASTLERAAFHAVDFLETIFKKAQYLAAKTGFLVPVMITDNKVVIVGMNSISVKIAHAFLEQGGDVKIIADQKEEILAVPEAITVIPADFEHYGGFVAAFRKCSSVDVVIGCHFKDPLTFADHFDEFQEYLKYNYVMTACIYGAMKQCHPEVESYIIACRKNQMPVPRGIAKAVLMVGKDLRRVEGNEMVYHIFAYKDLVCPEFV